MATEEDSAVTDNPLPPKYISKKQIVDILEGDRREFTSGTDNFVNVNFNMSIGSNEKEIVKKWGYEFYDSDSDFLKYLSVMICLGVILSQVFIHVVCFFIYKL